VPGGEFQVAGDSGGGSGASIFYSLSGPEDELGVVIFVTAGEYPTYAGGAAGTVRTTPTLCVHTFPLPFELWAEKLLSGIHLVTPSIRHVPPTLCAGSMPSRTWR